MMNRKIALEIAWTKNISELVNDIYDEFETRTCEHCDNYRSGNSTCDVICYDNEFLGNMYVNKDFGCNQFLEEED